MGTEHLSAQELQKEIEKIAEYINQAKQEIAAISLTAEKTGSNKNIAAAAMELNEVVRHTEEATNTIMDNAEAIMGIASGMGDGGIELNAHSLSILEACSFQDITGQRISKVLKTLEQIELRVGNLVNLFGGHLPEGFKVGEIETAPRRADEDLMEGPQLAAASQDDIDKLFNAS
jgi:chemotaxis protein CheZ